MLSKNLISTIVVDIFFDIKAEKYSLEARLTSEFEPVFSKLSFKVVISKPSDYKANKELMFFCQSNNLALEILEDKKFISDADDFADWASDKKTRIQEYYYRWLRKKYNIFMFLFCWKNTKSVKKRVPLK